MNKELANQIINEALNLAIQKGCYDLIAVTNIVSALSLLNSQQNINSNSETLIVEEKGK